MKQPWLDEEFSEIIDELKDRMLELSRYLSDSEIGTDTVKQLTDIISNLDELFLLVIVGEVKSGKSSMINALFGVKICPEGVIPVTDRINVLKYSEKPMEKYTGDFMVERFINFDKLRNMHIVDTPGTNSIIKQHQQITEKFIPHADLVIFCTSADRPYTQTEKDFLSLIAKDWRKRVFFLLTKIDIKNTEEEINEVINYIQTNVQNDFNFRPLIFPCSPKLAFDSKINNNPEMFEKSRFKAVEDYIFETLSERDKLQLKLINPVVSSLLICETSLAEFKTRMIIIEDHSKTIEDVRRIVKNQADAILEGYSRYILEISNLLTSVLNRSISFLEEKIVLRNFRNLMDRHKFKLEFNEIVLQEFEKKLWEIIQRATDDVVRKEMTIWSDAFNLYNEWVMLQQYKHNAISKVSAEFSYNRDKIVDNVKLKFDSSLNEFNYEKQTSRIFDLINSGIMQTFGTAIVGAGGGAIVGAAALSSFGMIIGSVVGLILLGALSAMILPRKRNKAIKEFKKKFEQLKTDIINVLEGNIKTEIDKLKSQIEEQLSPAFVHFQNLKEKTHINSKNIDKMQDTLKELKNTIEKQIERVFYTQDKLNEQMTPTINSVNLSENPAEQAEIEDAATIETPENPSDENE